MAAGTSAPSPAPAPARPPSAGIDDARPPPPAAAGRQATSADASDEEVPAEERAGREFWDFVDDALGRKPDTAALLSIRSFPAERPAERARLVRFARQLVERFPSVPQARALASLTLLHAAAQAKERGLLTGVNRERLELIREGLGLLDADRAAAAHVSVLFEHDGRATRAAFVATVELLADYLAFCHSSALDPRAADSAARFTSLP